jgi:hypothetical protein
MSEQEKLISLLTGLSSADNYVRLNAEDLLYSQFIFSQASGTPSPGFLLELAHLLLTPLNPSANDFQVFLLPSSFTHENT